MVELSDVGDVDELEEVAGDVKEFAIAVDVVASQRVLVGVAFDSVARVHGKVARQVVQVDGPLGRVLR